MVIYLCQKHIKWGGSHKNQYREVYKFMRKTVKKLTAVGLTLTSVMGLVACGNNNASTENKSTVDWASVEKPESFTVMVDGTVPQMEEWGDKFDEQLKQLTELDFEVVRPDHNSYYDAVANSMLDASAMPDVLILSSDYLALYAGQGLIWDMTDAWNNSETKASGRLVPDAEKIMKANYVRGVDGEKALYGFVPARGNGCCTYIKVSSLEAAGYKADEVANKTMTYDEYYKLLKDIQAASDNKNFVISTSGFVAGGNSGKTEAPYTNYLPEFYQDAQFTFYLKDGKYVDGFAEDSMKKAMDRLKTAVSDGIIDKASQNQSTSDARKKWQSADKSTTSSVFSYWAGTWAQTLTNNLPDKSDSLIAIKPIKELGKYTERLAPAWAITYKAYENGKAEGIFKYFIDTMLDGGDIQVAWEYGAKGTHWDDKAEDVTLKGKEDKVSSYKEGEFHFLPTPEDATKLMSKNHVDPSLAIADFGDKTDPGAKAVTQIVTDCYKMFNANSEIAAVLPATEVLNNNIVDINTKRLEVLSQVVLGEKTYDEAMADYNKQVGAKITAVIESLNETIK